MGLFDRFREPGSVGLVESGPQYPVVPLQDMIDTHDVVTVGDGFLVMTPRSLADLNPPDIGREIGGYGSSVYGSIAREEYNPRLRGAQGLGIYDEMRRSDAQVRMSLRIIKTPVLGARWYMEPASDSKKDIKVAQFVWDNLTKYMNVSWPQFLIEALAFLDFGHYSFEKVFDIKNIDGKDMIIWRKFAPRHPIDNLGWKLDEHGGPNGAMFRTNNDIGFGTFIPIDKLLVFTYEKEAGNMDGISVLRSAYKHWYFKDNLYKIDAIQKERHGIGIPIIKLPPNFTQADKDAANELGRNLRTNEKAHVVLPPMWDIVFADMKGQQPIDCISSIEHHDKLIARNVLAEFMLDNSTGSGDVQRDMFLKGTRFIADIIRDVFNKWAIPELVDYNFKVDAYPELKVRRIGDTVDWRVISFAIRNLIGAGVLRPDDKLEEWIRDEMDLPKVDIASLREVKTPQAPSVGPPKQSTTAGMQQGKNAGNNNSGEDKSGG